LREREGVEGVRLFRRLYNGAICACAITHNRQAPYTGTKDQRQGFTPARWEGVAVASRVVRRVKVEEWVIVVAL
jgi:hypothetical protein